MQEAKSVENTVARPATAKPARIPRQTPLVILQFKEPSRYPHKKTARSLIERVWFPRFPLTFGRLAVCP